MSQLTEDAALYIESEADFAMDWRRVQACMRHRVEVDQFVVPEIWD